MVILTTANDNRFVNLTLNHAMKNGEASAIKVNLHQKDVLTMESHPELLPDGRIPLVLGVTGHRDMLGKEVLQATLEKDVALLRTQYPHTPLVALSALAEGADRLFAEVCLVAGIPLHVVLPFSGSEYEKDFPDSVEPFRALCARAASITVAPWAMGVTGENIRTDRDATHQENRNLQYAMAGIYLSQRAHILFALWDGKPAQGLGGAAQVVQYRTTGHLRESGIPEDQIHRLHPLVSMSLLDDPEMALIRHIPVRRAQAPVEAVDAPQWVDSAGVCRLNVSDQHDTMTTPPCLMNTALGKIEAYNQLVGHGFIGNEGHSASGQEASPLDLEDHRLTMCFNRADQLANTQMYNVRQTFKRIFWLASGAALSHEFYVEAPQHWHGFFMVLYLALLLGIGWQVWQMRQHRQNAEAIDYRALAEGLRIQQAWFRSGLVHQVSNHYLRRYGPGLGWVRLALQGVSLTYRTDIQASDLEVVREQWVGDQKQYLEKSLLRREKIIHQLSRWSGTLFVAGIFVALLTLVIRVAQFFPDNSVFLIGLDLCFGLLPAAAGLLSGYLEFAAYEDDVREHTRIKGLFEKAYGHMKNRTLTLTDQQRLIHELGLEALNENASWAILHKNHDAKTPMG